MLQLGMGGPWRLAPRLLSNLLPAAPVQVCRSHIAAGGGVACAVVINSGCANAATGPEGRRAAELTCELTARALRSDPEHVLVCSTGTIGTRLPIERIEAALPALIDARGGSPERGQTAARAILTTDTRTEGGRGRAGRSRRRWYGEGSGHAGAEHGDDAGRAHDGRGRRPRPCCRLRSARQSRRSFNEMTVDGCTSTNDSVIVLASGLGREVPEAALAEALTAACAELALQMVADAEGGTKVVRVRVIGAADSDSALRAARRVAESNLVKSSWYGEDANWGRILSELGSAGTPFDPDRVTVAYGSVTVCRDGVGVDHDDGRAEQGALRSRVRDHLRSRPRERVGVDDQRRPHAGLRRAQHGTIVSRVDLPAPVKAAVLCDALPYIRRFAGRTVVVKYGGNALADQVAGESSRTLEQFAEDVVLLQSIGILPVVVHGGGPQIGSLMARLGKVPEFRGGLRVTDSETLDIARMVLVGKVNRDIVGVINVHGPIAVGLSGEDAGLITAAARDPELGYVGDVVAVDPSILHRLLAEGLVPVIATIGSDPSGQAYNINADTVAGAIAETLMAEKLVFLTDVEGIRSDAADPTTLLHELGADELDALVASGAVAEGMVPKAAACAHAVRHGVASAHVLDGRVAHAILLELLTSEGVGTMVVAS